MNKAAALRDLSNDSDSDSNSRLRQWRGFLESNELGLSSTNTCNGRDVHTCSAG